MKYLLISLCVAAVTLLGLYVQPVYAGAWVPALGSGYHKLAFNYFEANELFGPDDDFENFTSESITYYFEAGIGNDFALFGSLPLQDLSQRIGGVQTESFGVGDVELGLRKQWVSDPFVLSTSFTFKAPYFYDENAALPRGNGQEDYELRILFGKSLGEYGYFGVEGGYRFRTDDPSDEIRYLFEYGIGFGDNFYARTKLDGILSANNASATTLPSGNLSVPPQFDLGKLELTAGWNFGKPRPRTEGRWGMEFTWTRDLYGEDTLKGNTYQIGLTFVH